MEHFQPALDPRKQELLEARFLGTRVRFVICSEFCVETASHISVDSGCKFVTLSSPLIRTQLLVYGG
jgi:hypothetical protein